jgi:carbonic anhydrase/acetyltransferase-like protein (isoleucine patch superfamily)
MKRIEQLIDRIIDRVNINLREPAFDVGPYVRGLVPVEQFERFYAFYGLSPHHPLHFHFRGSSLAGSYFLGKCIVEHSVLYKSDIRGDELKMRGDVLCHKGLQVPLHDDEVIWIKDGFLVKTLVHNYSHDPENPEEFLIQNTVSLHYANIHGAPVEGSFLGPFATVDLTTVHDCVIGPFAYVQVGELAHREVEPGTIWIRSDGDFDFRYRFPGTVLKRYVNALPGKNPEGVLMDFVEARKEDFQEVFDGAVRRPPRIDVPPGAALSRYAVVRGDTEIAENVLVAQRAYLEDAYLGKGANAQENCYIIRSRLQGWNVTAHGGKIIHAVLEPKVFVGFNAFLRASEDCPLKIGEGSIVMPHTLVDLEEPVDIPPGRLVWGYVSRRADLEHQSLALEDLSRVEGLMEKGSMRFEGSGARFVEAFRHRIEHILEANGAYFDGTNNVGHAQKGQNISFNIMQPHPEGEMQGLYPTIDIRP